MAQKLHGLLSSSSSNMLSICSALNIEPLFLEKTPQSPPPRPGHSKQSVSHEVSKDNCAIFYFFPQFIIPFQSIYSRLFIFTISRIFITYSLIHKMY